MSYTELAYIEATGTQYIDTGIFPNPNYSIEVSFRVVIQTTNWDTIFGTRNSANSRFTARFKNAEDGALGLQYSSSGSGKATLIDTQYKKSSFKNGFGIVRAKKNLWYIGDDLAYSFNPPADSVNYPYSLFLFANNNAGTPGDYAYIRIAYCKIWDGNAELARDFIPVLDESGVACLYDKVSGTYFYNQGTGSFVAGKIADDGMEYMPIMIDVNAYFDARENINETSWGNLAGDINIELFSPTISGEGVEVVGSETSYGKFTKQWVSGSSRTWYFVFKNVSGAFANWKTIIGNEASQYRCSTIAMDANGYIKFTRPDIIPSTSLGFKCSDWHVVAWVSDASTGRTRLWIDGTYISYVNNMQGWADDTYLCRGSGWWYDDNNTAFRAIAIADSAHSDAAVVTNSNWLYDHYVSNYQELKECRYLVRSASTLYTVTDGALSALTETEVTASLFQTYGVDDLPDGSLLLGLTDPEVLCWHEDELPTLTMTVQGTSPPQTVVTDVIANEHESVTGITSLVASSSDDVLFSLSIDEGQTWFIYDDSQGAWVISVDGHGMSNATLNALTSDAIDNFIQNKSFQIRFILASKDSVVDTITVNYSISS